MSRLNAPPARSTTAESDIYTVLLLVGFLSLLVAIVVMAVRAQTLFGSPLPIPGS